MLSITSVPSGDSTRKPCLLRRHIRGIFGALFFLAPTFPLLAAVQPNVLFIAIDDLGTWLGCYRDPQAKTPNIDRLAARAVLFDSAWCQYPLCNPSRASLLSGLRPDRTGVFDNTTPTRTHLGAVEFLPEFFRRQGWFTARIGKINHGKFEDAITWDLSEKATAGPGYQRPKLPARPEDAQAGERVFLEGAATANRDEDEPDGHTARRVAELLEKHQGGRFFIAAGFGKPHLPFTAPKKYFDLHPAKDIALPQVPFGGLKDTPRSALKPYPQDASLTDADRRELISAYYACVSFVDAQVGLILDTLDRLQLTEKTIVVLFGDHGFHLADHGGMWSKHDLFAVSSRAPLLIAAPGKRGGEICAHPVEFLDLYPTLADLCGLPLPAHLQGVSLRPLLDDPKHEWRRAAFTQVGGGKGGGRSVQTLRWRYTEWGPDGANGIELYDRAADSGEFFNLAANPRHATTVQALRAQLHSGSAILPVPGISLE